MFINEVDFFRFRVNNGDILHSLEVSLQDFKPKKLCDCGIFFTSKFQVCLRCYMYTQHQEDNCIICMENGLGIWVKNNDCECKINLHYECMMKVKKCPTCRLDYEPGNFTYL